VFVVIYVDTCNYVLLIV